ncbi:Rare lipoprotein A [Lysobacter dokdonensis DS-58]|uniref:Endolytic peptidoglycan transglycosylase RlpA n=1 Tax=Lysobacter dokdonensis DS-58 TaxID=1300345 RepID=A0A0A2WI94_9GAMM|nr:septal ring lytic transglycosylase RlpA family protein [Lysobacter dokdonensis]KGQ17975.1 Rare lipoprotein A [Lysobacter dokdonensis DS-58]
MKRALPVVCVLLAACSGAPSKSPPPSQSASTSGSRAPASASGAQRRSPYAPAQEDTSKRGDYTAGGLYAPLVKDSAPPPIDDVHLIPEPDVVPEPRSRYGNRDYTVLGKQYHVLDDPSGYVESGTASFYGQKFHGRRTSSLEVYDMYAFSAAHKTLPLPSFARVTNLANGKSVIVRVNDRGPFHDGRVIDLSYAAAVKLGVYPAGTARVEVRALTVDDRGPDMRVAAPDPAPPPVAPSAMDRMVAALPIAGAEAGERKPAAASNEPEPTPPGPWRFDMRQDGKAMTADEFDKWMKERQVRVATGKSGTPDKRQADTPVAPVKPPPRVDTAASNETRPAPAVKGDDVVLQVASFAARANAERALAMLEGAGIRDARLLDANASGQKVWRLRVGPVASERVAELSATVAGLGFGRPNVVRD